MGDHYQLHYGAAGGGTSAMNCIKLQKNVTFYLVDGNSGHNTAYFSYPTLPNSKSAFRLCGSFWSFKYFFEQSNAGSNLPSAAALHNHRHHQQQPHSGTKIESDACQMYLYLGRASDQSEVEFQLYCDSGSKANVGGWTLTQMKWVSVKIQFISPETKQAVSHKRAEGEPRCGKVLCRCKQTKMCLCKGNFCSTDYLQSFYVINKCTRPQYGMSTSYYVSLDAIVSVTFFPQNPKSVGPSGGSLFDLYWKSQQEASKRIFHSKIGTDFKLEVNGKEFPCHKCILAGHSEVFNKMFMMDAKRHQQLLPTSASFQGKLVMENISVLGLESFLKYLYYGDTFFTELPVSVPFELAQAAEKYNIPHLRRTSLDVLLSKSADDFDCGTALNMYLFIKNSSSNNLGQYSSLKRVALQCFSKNYEELVKSEVFVKLFAKNRESAQEMLIKIYKHKKP